MRLRKGRHPRKDWEKNAINERLYMSVAKLLEQCEMMMGMFSSKNSALYIFGGIRGLSQSMFSVFSTKN
jgi:hypothetical protein